MQPAQRTSLQELQHYLFIFMVPRHPHTESRRERRRDDKTPTQQSMQHLEPHRRLRPREEGVDAQEDTLVTPERRKECRAPKYRQPADSRDKVVENQVGRLHGRRCPGGPLSRCCFCGPRWRCFCCRCIAVCRRARRAGRRRHCSGVRTERPVRSVAERLRSMPWMLDRYPGPVKQAVEKFVGFF